LDHSNQCEDECGADNESHIVVSSGIKALETPEHNAVSAAPNVPRLIRPICNSIKHAETQFVMFSTLETRRNNGHKNKEDSLGPCVFTTFHMLLDR
jgi:hypothetical protein